MPKLDKVLQKDVIAIMLNEKKAVAELRKIIRPELFTSGAYRFLCRFIFSFYDKYNGELPTTKAVLLEINKKIKDDDQKNLFKSRALPLFKRDVKSSSFIKEEIIAWAEKQEFGRLIEQAARYGAENELDKAKELLKSSFLFDISRHDFSIYSVLEEWKTRQRQRKHESISKEYKYIQTGLGNLDELMGLRTNESMLALIMGTSGVGKSIFSINFGAYGIYSGCKVAHFVFENTAKQTLTRYDSRLIKYPYINLATFKWTKADLTLANMLMRSLRNRFSESIKVIHAPIETVNVTDIESILREIELNSGWKPDVIIYDSGDHLLPSKSTESYRLGVKRVFTEIKRQTEIRNIPIISTTHAKASARGTRVRQESFSESYDKSRLSDIVLTISQTQEQEDDRQAEFWLDKCRDREGKYGILLDLLFRYMTLKFAEELGSRRDERITEESEEE